ncbi:TPA: hypothetical protein EYP38_01670 [Candidatus Micrarchaeota archaeon]|nr:hypothetical protein [Candidatus Micrarchaeota archaeon]
MQHKHGEDVCSKRPKLLVTSPVGKESWAEVEVGNALFHGDPRVKVEKAAFPGVLLVYTSLSAEEAFKLVRKQYLAFVNRVVPVHTLSFLTSAGEVEKFVRNFLLQERERLKGRTVSVRVALRGVRSDIGETQLLNAIASELAKIGSLPRREGAELCLLVESVHWCFMLALVERAACERGRGAHRSDGAR